MGRFHAQDKMEFSVSGKTDTGRKREANEDSFFCDPERAFAFVADGMGGHKGGATASQVAKQIISTYLADYEKKGRLSRSSIIGAVREANTRVFELSEANEELSGMGTTVSLLALSGSTALIAQVGDSRVYLYRDGTLRQVTVDHSWVQEQVRAKIITEEQAREDPRRHWILRALGQENEVEVDIFHVKLRVNDVFVLCSDGLHDMVPDAEIAEIVSGSELRPDQLCEDLVHAANEHGGEDNISVVALRVDEVRSTAVRAAVLCCAVFVCLLLSVPALLRILPRSDGGSPGSTPATTSGTQITREPPEIEAPRTAAETQPVEQENVVPDESPSEVVGKEPPSAEPSLADVKRLARDRSLDRSTRLDAYKKAAVMCVAENSLSEMRDLLQAAVVLDASLSYSEDDTSRLELDETMLKSLSEAVAEAKWVAYARKRNASDAEATMKAVADDARSYVAAASDIFNKADDLVEAGRLPEALDTLSEAEESLERALAEYRKDKTACTDAVGAARAQVALLEDLERWNVKLLESDLKAIQAAENEMTRLLDRGEFRSAIDRGSDIRSKVADVAARAAANRQARQSAADVLDNAASLVSAVGTGLPTDYSAETKERLERFQRELEGARLIAAQGEFKEAQIAADRIGEECKKLVGQMFQVLKDKRASLLDGLPREISEDIERAGLDKALAAADAVDSPPGEAVPELLRLFGVAAQAVDSLDVAVKDAIAKSAAWRREADRFLAEAGTHLVRVRERFQKGGGSDQALRFWLDKCESGPLSGLLEVSGVPKSFADSVAQLRDLVRSHSKRPSFRISDSDIKQIEDRLKELRKIVAEYSVG